MTDNRAVRRATTFLNSKLERPHCHFVIDPFGSVIQPTLFQDPLLWHALRQDIFRGISSCELVVKPVVSCLSGSPLFRGRDDGRTIYTVEPIRAIGTIAGTMSVYHRAWRDLDGTVPWL